MAYGTRPGGGGHTIRTFRPDDTEDTLCCSENVCLDLAELRKQTQAKWPGIQDDELVLEAQHIQTDCVYNREYDSTDYTNYIIITASKSYFERIERMKMETTVMLTTNHLTEV